MQPAPPTVLTASPIPTLVWPAAALVVAAVSFALPVVRSTWWMNPDNYALLAWGRQVSSLHQISLENGFTTPHPLPMALGALFYHSGTPIEFFTFLSVVALLVIAVSAGIAAHRRAGVAAAVLAILLIATSDALGESAALRGVDLLSTAAIAAALAVAPDRWKLRVALICVAGLVRPEPWALAAAVAFLGYQGPLLRRVAAGVVSGLIAPILWTAYDWIVAGDPLLAVNRTDDLADIARDLTPLRQAPRAILTTITSLDGLTLFVLAAACMTVVLVAALRHGRLPADPLPFLIVTVIPCVLLVEIARDYPLRLRYLLPLAVVIAIEAAVAFAYVGGLLNRRFPGLRPYVAGAFAIVAGSAVVFTVSRAPEVHTPTLPFVSGGVQLLDTYKLDCRQIGYLAGGV
ncbi:MAG: hypothetical protein QOE98_2457, partial [Gaiellaceae bacterium]|nr:hypothetical protein [Gaiellaceae bacterium]